MAQGTRALSPWAKPREESRGRNLGETLVQTLVQTLVGDSGGNSGGNFAGNFGEPPSNRRVSHWAAGTSSSQDAPRPQDAAPPDRP